ncbi:alpha/beta hydrolase [Chryseolinea sp. H1M3-3]|uniref:alpha/beta hydrolase n=1 Tax=Chryseolinea sp. H1M3-3 TaxID=3034144 RepID=UPI0023EC6C6C|nr:alpha/beta hydrolase [Chryseolinea sp. H1M3-3]
MPRLVYLLSFFCIAFSSEAQTVKNIKDIIYAETGSRKLLLDLYMPSNPNPYLIVWIHGGAWHSGSKESPPVIFLSSGYAIASVDYRLSIEAKFPAQIHDIKAAVRYLRANATKHGYHADKIIIAGSSAGGHLATLVGVTNNDPALEGTLGLYTQTSSSIQAIVDYYGPSNFTSIMKQSTPHGVGVRGPAIALLLGHTVDNATDMAKKASPVMQVEASDPPLLIFHGDQDIQVPINQSHELVGVYKANGLKVQLEVVHGAGHTEKPYFDPQYQRIVETFLADVLKN